LEVIRAISPLSSGFPATIAFIAVASAKRSSRRSALRDAESGP